ncbi:MAG: tetratricopeptide repeat protein [Candidatus Melainabacteria bacterium]|nr:tetratricopeptide repeat protein [Candidatus Melainabacteria bacterium]
MNEYARTIALAQSDSQGSYERGHCYRAHPHLSRGIAYARLGKYKPAIKDFDEAIRQTR